MVPLAGRNVRDWRWRWRLLRPALGLTRIRLDLQERAVQMTIARQQSYHIWRSILPVPDCLGFTTYLAYSLYMLHFL